MTEEEKRKIKEKEERRKQMKNNKYMGIQYEEKLKKQYNLKNNVKKPEKAILNTYEKKVDPEELKKMDEYQKKLY